MTIVIGLAGGAGSGKSTAATFLVDRYGAKRFAFADPLKQIAMRTLKFTHEQCYGTQAEKEAIDPRYNFSPRQFLQWLGTEGIRTVLGEDFWWQFALDTIRREAPALAVIEDVRFPNEANALLERAAVEEQRMLSAVVDSEAAVWAASMRASLQSNIVGHVWRLWPAPDAPKNSTADATHASEAQVYTLPVSAEVRPPKYGLDALHATLVYHAHDIGLVMP